MKRPKRKCYYCETDVTEGDRLSVRLLAERVWTSNNNVQSKGIYHRVLICSTCAREHFGIRILVHSNVEVELKLLVQQMLPVKRIRKWNPTRR